MVNDTLSSFLETFPTQTMINSFSNDDNVNDPLVIHDKIKSAFSGTDLSPLKGILQFWAPIDGRRQLSCSDQPFTFAYLNPARRKYRLTCINYRFSIDHDVNSMDDDDYMIINGLPAIAFLNRFPLVFDLTLQQDNDNPFVRLALERGLTTLLVPVFYPSLTSCCVGVVECCVKLSRLSIFEHLKLALEKIGLSTYHVHVSHPYKDICGLGRGTNEFEDAFKIICESHDLNLAQVWIRLENENPFPFSSSLEDNQTKQK